MSTARLTRTSIRWLAGGLGLAAAAYTWYVGRAWYRYGRPAHATGLDDVDPLLDRFMPVYEIVERHRLRVAAPADITLASAAAMDLQQSAIIRAIFNARELFLGADPGDVLRPRELLAQVMSLGWGVLAEVPGREIVVGAVTQPWLADVTFRALPADDFLAFSEPGYVKIAWTLRADPMGPEESMFRTETRAVATDPTARARFRWYWARFSPGIVLIRRISLGIVKANAERRARITGHSVRAARAVAGD
jgi:hypothetical protein